MRKATTLVLSSLLLAVFTSCAQDTGVKSGAATGEALFDLLPGSTKFVVALNIKRLMEIDPVVKAMQDPKSKERYDEFVKMSGIDPKKDIDYVGVGAPYSEDARRVFMPTRKTYIENASIVVSLKYDKSRLQGLVKEKVPEAKEDMYNGVTIYSNPAADESWKWIRAAFLDESHIVLGSDKGVKAVIDVYQKKAESLAKSEFTAVLKSVGDKKINVIKVVREVTNLGLKEAKDLVDGAPMPLKEGVTKEEGEAIKAKFAEVGAVIELEMTALLSRVDKSGIAWCAASYPAGLIKKAADSYPQLEVVEWLIGMTLALDDKNSEIVAEFRSLGGTTEQNTAMASQLNGLRAFGTMHLNKEPALEELLNAIDITSGNDFIRLTASASHETVGRLWRLARTKAGDATRPNKDEPQQDDPGVPGSARDQEAGMLADAAFRERILAQAEEMHGAIMSGDLDKFITYMLPQLIAQAGGAAAIKQAIKPGLAEMPRIVEKISLGTISPVVSEADGLAAFVPVEMDFRIKGIRLIHMSYYVAFSEDMGLNWKFMSSQGQPQQDRWVRQLFPKLTSRIALPKCGQFTPYW